MRLAGAVLEHQHPPGVATCRTHDGGCHSAVVGLAEFLACAAREREAAHRAGLPFHVEQRIEEVP